MRRGQSTTETGTPPAAQAEAAGAANAAQRQALATAFERDWEPLLVSARVNVRATGLDQHGATEALAHEVLNQACVTALENAERFDPTRPALPWLRGIIFNTARSLARDRGLQRRREPRIVDAAPRSDDPDGEPNEADAIERLREMGHLDDPADRLIVEEHLALVPEAEAQLLRWAAIEGRDASEIAARLGIRVGAVYTRLNRARNRLRAALQQADMGGR